MRQKQQETSRVAIIAAAIRNAIIEQALGSGTRLPEDAIGERFGVSRTIVRQAIGQLAAEGLVIQRRNRSAIVAEPSWTDATDTFEIRLALELIVVRRLVGKLTAEQLKVLRKHVQKEDKAKGGKTETQSIRLAGEFHALLADLTGSAILAEYMRELTSRCGLILAVYSRPHSSECGVSEHRELVELLAKGDEAATVKAMRTHMQAVTDRALIRPVQREDRGIAQILESYASG